MHYDIRGLLISFEKPCLVMSSKDMEKLFLLMIGMGWKKVLPWNLIKGENMAIRKQLRMPHCGLEVQMRR